jgi:hypothetical protein
LANVAQPKAIEIELPGEDQEDKPKKKPGRPKASKPKQTKVDTKQVELILLTVSGIIASREGMEVWNLTAEESKQLAEPIANIMAKNEALANVAGEHADAFALVMALFAIFVPKFLVWNATKPKKPKKGELVKYESTRKPAELQKQKGTTGSGPTNDDRQPTHTPKTAGANFGGQLYNLVPTIAGI